MTKTYIKPESVTVKVELQQMIAGTTPNPTVNPDPATTDPTTGDYDDARFFGLFFEEEENEEEY